MLVPTYQITRCHKLKYHNLNLALLHLIWNEAAGGYRDKKKQGTAKLNHSCVHNPNPVLSCAAIQLSPVQITSDITGCIIVGIC
jgi:hypothetical protein